MKPIIFTVFFVLIISALFAQYDERQILTQQANQYLSTRQYSEAESVFLQILQKYPDDINSILQLMQIYLSLSQGEKAETLLAKFQRTIPASLYSEQRIQLLILQGKLDEARRESDGYLLQYPLDQNKYRLIASFFERRAHYDVVIELYQKARSELGKADLFSLEIANAYMQSRIFEPALREYLGSMVSSVNVNFFVKSQINTIVKEDSTLIKVVGEYAKASPTPVMNELYATALITLKQYSQAMEIYKNLSPSYMRDFANEQIRLGNYDLALPAFKHLAQTTDQPYQRLMYGLEVAKIYHKQAEYDSTSTVLNQMMKDPFWRASPMAMKNKLNVDMRRLMAENSMAKGDDIDSVKAWIQEAKTYSTQAVETQEVELELARLNILTANYTDAEASLQRISIPEMQEKRDYLGYLSKFLQGEVELADSLMNEFIITHPGGEYANDIIYLNMLVLNMEQPDQQRFTKAIAGLQLYNIGAIDSLAAIYEHNQDEEVLLLAIEWAIGLSQYDKARQLLTHEFTDELSAEYAQLLRLALLSDKDEEQRLAREFLKAKPNSIFSPRFRQVISRGTNSKISL